MDIIILCLQRETQICAQGLQNSGVTFQSLPAFFSDVGKTSLNSSDELSSSSVSDGGIGTPLVVSVTLCTCRRSWFPECLCFVPCRSASSTSLLLLSRASTSAGRTSSYNIFTRSGYPQRALLNSRLAVGPSFILGLISRRFMHIG